METWSWQARLAGGSRDGWVVGAVEAGGGREVVMERWSCRSRGPGKGLNKDESLRAPASKRRREPPSAAPFIPVIYFDRPAASGAFLARRQWWR